VTAPVSKLVQPRQLRTHSVPLKMADTIGLNFSSLGSHSFDELRAALEAAEIQIPSNASHADLVALVLKNYSAVDHVVQSSKSVSAALDPAFLAPVTTAIDEHLLNTYTSSLKLSRSARDRARLMEYAPPITNLPPVCVTRKIDTIAFSDTDRARESFLYKMSGMIHDLTRFYLHLADAYIPALTSTTDVEFVHSGIMLHADAMRFLDEERRALWLRTTKMGAVELSDSSPHDLITDDLRKAATAQALLKSQLYAERTSSSNANSNSQRGRGGGRGSGPSRRGGRGSQGRGQGKGSQQKSFTNNSSSSSSHASADKRPASSGGAQA
jgi:hypothetical protein